MDTNETKRNGVEGERGFYFKIDHIYANPVQAAGLHSECWRKHPWHTHSVCRLQHPHTRVRLAWSTGTHAPFSSTSRRPATSQIWQSQGSVPIFSPRIDTSVSASLQIHTRDGGAGGRSGVWVSLSSWDGTHEGDTGGVGDRVGDGERDGDAMVKLGKREWECRQGR